MNLVIALAAAVVGYLVGSISFAVVITRLVAPEGKLSKIQLTVPGSEAHLESDSISATTVRMQLGARYGCLVSLLDMGKAAAPALAFKAWQPDAPYYLIAAGMATVGHNWPIFHGFKGGRGLSSILGGMFVLDWLGVIVTNLIGAAVGIPLKNMFITTGGGIVLMIPWLWIRTQDPAQILYAIAMNILYWTAMVPEIREFRRLADAGELKDLQEAKEYKIIGADGTERVDNITIPAIQERIAAFFGRKKEGD